MNVDDSTKRSEGTPQRFEDVRLKYLEARRDEHTFNAMQIARKVAEAVCDALEGTIPEAKRDAYQSKSDLNHRLGMLEGLATAKIIALPRAVVAALRTLQAFGNYASHDAVGEHQPPQRASASAMASLSLVAEWFLWPNEEGERSGGMEVQFREPPPAAPTFWEQRKILAATPTERQELQFEGGTRGYANVVDPAEPAGVQLATMFAHCAKLVTVCEAVSRAVVARETTLDVSTMPLEQLAFVFARVAEERPARIPRRASAAVDEVLRRRSTILRAIQVEERDIESLKLEAKQADPTDALVSWFERDYVAKTHLEQHWRGLVFWPLMVSSVVWLAWNVGDSAGREEKAKELRERFCPPAAGGPVNASDLCKAVEPTPYPNPNAGK